MKCYYCKSNRTSQIRDTKFGYEQFQCHHCGKKFNERTGTPFNRLQCKTETVFVAIYYYVVLSNSYRQVSSMLLERGVNVSHEEVRKWVNVFSPNIVRKFKKNEIEMFEKNMVH
jgi:putative transposase